jgi:3-oxoacyl-[acyl-carrier-protein] synthase II
MHALSTRNDEPERASRPWDKGRDGFVFGEGCAVMVLESEGHARARGARCYAEVAGAGVSSDGSDSMVQPDPTGAGAARAMIAALADAGADASEVVHVNAHGTSTPQGDVAEAEAIGIALGAHTPNVAVTSTKSMTGHLLGAAGAVESLAVVMALYERQAPPTINLDDPDDAVSLDIITGSPRPLPEGPIVALNNSFGFGGHNIALAFRSLA